MGRELEKTSRDIRSQVKERAKEIWVEVLQTPLQSKKDLSVLLLILQALIICQRNTISLKNVPVLTSCHVQSHARSSQWEAWSQCKYSSGFQSATAGAIHQLHFLQLEIYKSHFQCLHRRVKEGRQEKGSEPNRATVDHCAFCWREKKTYASQNSKFY